MGKDTVSVRLTVNDEDVQREIPAGLSALAFIRDVLGLKGTKEGCGIGECGACTIEVDGKAVNACLMFAAQLDGRRVLTVEGLGRGEALHPIQEAFVANHAVQCGFCTPGLLMSTHALLQENPSPGPREISRALAGNLCRCTGYQSILAAVTDAAERSKRPEKT